MQESSLDLNAFLHQCRDASARIDSSLFNDEAVPPRWPFDCSPPSSMYKKDGVPAIGGLQQARLIPFPPLLIERHQSSSIDYWRMGIFPEICRVWVVLEHRLYLWNYMETGSTDVIELETPLQERIFGVGLATPPKGLFNGNVQKILVIVTPSYVLLHEVVFSTGHPHDEVRLVPTDYFVPSDDLCGVGVPHPLHQPKVRVVASENGRIFLCGQDSTVHEFLYPPDAGLFGGWIPSAKCRKVSHFDGLTDRKRWMPPMLSRLVAGSENQLIDVKIDDSRKHLYTLGMDATVTIYNIAGNPNETAVVMASGIVKVSRHSATPGQVVGIGVIPLRGKPTPNDRIQPEFVVFLAHGVCISYRVDSRRKIFVEVSQIAPDTTADKGACDGDAQMQVNVCHYSTDMVLMAHDGVYPDRVSHAATDRSASDRYLQRTDAILHCVHATGHEHRVRQPNREPARPYALSQHLLVNSGVLALAEVPMELVVPQKLWKLAETEWTLPELSSQPWLASMISDDGRDASRWILVLSKAGLHCFVKTRPIDQVRSVLAANQLPSAQLISTAPLDMFNQAELYSMFLQLACAEIPLGGASDHDKANICEQAKQLFMTDAPGRNVQPVAGGAMHAGVSMWGYQPTPWGHFGAATDRVSYVSDRHCAVAFYVARILRPIFSKTINEIYQVEPYKKAVLCSIQQRLGKLRNFLESLPTLERPQFREPQRMYDSIDEPSQRTKAEEEKVEMTKLYFLVCRCEEACKRLQGDAQRFHGKIGEAQSRQNWQMWQSLTFKELVTEEKGQKLFYKVHSRLFLNELREMGESEAHCLLQLPSAGSSAASTFWGSWVQRRLQAERHLQQARTKMEQGRQLEAKEQLRLALVELTVLVQRDPVFTHEDLRASCELLIDSRFSFFECYQGYLTLCLERIKVLRMSQNSRLLDRSLQIQNQPTAQEEIEWCYDLIGQLVSFTYFEPPRIGLKVTSRPLAWPAGGMSPSLDLVPKWFLERHSDDAAEMSQLQPRQLHSRCATICRSQLLSMIFQAQPYDLFDTLHEQLYIWFLQHDFLGAQTGATALQPGLFDLFDYATTDKRRIQPWFLEQYLERLTSMSENMASGSGTPTGVNNDFDQAVDTLCTYYEMTLQNGKAARKYWRLATAPQQLALSARIQFMMKAIAIERRLGVDSRRASECEVLGGPHQEGSLVPQVEALSWPKFLQVAELQLEAVTVLRDHQSDTSILHSPGPRTPGVAEVPSTGGLPPIADDQLLSLQDIIRPLRQTLERSRRIDTVASGGAHVARLLLCCYNAAVLPPQDRQALQPYICQLWAAVIEFDSSIEAAVNGVVHLHRNHSLGTLVFTLEDQGGQRGLLYLLERVRFDSRAREVTVAEVCSVCDCAAMLDGRNCSLWRVVLQPFVDECHIHEERLSRGYYTLITAEADPAFKLHLLDAATAFLVRWQNCVRTAVEGAGGSAAVRYGLHEQRRRLLAQCAELLAEYRHLCHATASCGPAGDATDLQSRIGRSLEVLEVGQRELLDMLEN